MKKGFTLVEMLIVVTVLVTLMTMVFRLGSVGGDSSRRNRTISRMQRVENCLSGYYAAFGSYPPVKLHGTRNIYARANSHGIQSDSQENKDIWNWSKIGEANEYAAWNQVNAACRSQPIDACFPFPEKYSGKIAAVSDELKRRAQSGEKRYEAYWKNENTKAKLTAGFDDASSQNIGRFNDYAEEVDWNKVQLFKFGLMSYLLPRYLVMMNGHESFFENYAQWTANNVAKPQDAIGGDELDWKTVQKYQSSDDPMERASIANMPSQSVTARWMPNLEGIVSSEHEWTLFGVVVSSSDTSDRNLSSDNPNIDVYEAGDYGNDSHNQQYVLDYVTVQDGWYNNLYYYSPAPYQSYVLWSAGPNGRTFPPWVPLDSDDLKEATSRGLIGLWTQDDYTQMSN